MTTDVSITELARTAGLETDWTDAGGIARRVDDDALVALVDALGWPCGTAAQRAPPRSPTRTRRPRASSPATQACRRSCRPRSRRPARASGSRSKRAGMSTGAWAAKANTARCRRSRSPATTRSTSATSASATIAPPRAQPVDPRAADAGGRWGIAAQLYSLRRAGDDGAGDYTALARLAAHAARHGAQAVAISPTHAAFPALPAHDSPYSPSSRRWHNVAYLDCDAVPAPLPCLTQPVPRPTHR